MLSVRGDRSFSFSSMPTDGARAMALSSNARGSGAHNAANNVKG
jgi:hypothetical protein